MRYRVVIQARTSSVRLPGKVLLPIGGLPLAVLVARRAGRRNKDVVVATSAEPDDDELVAVLEEHQIRCVRGSLKNVLARFVRATEDLPDDHIVVRLTADNPIPDDSFLSDCIETYCSTGADYISYGGDGHWLPYGVTAEVFRVQHLRKASAYECDPYVLEHVTPTIRAAYASPRPPPFPNWTEDLGYLRCTVDTLDDYEAMVQLFDGFTNPVEASWRDLVARYAAARRRKPASLVLGGAQLGIAYGINKQAGVMPTETVNKILSTAVKLGCREVDTARAYGQSEERIGAFLHANPKKLTVITKVAPMPSGKEEFFQADVLRAKTVESVNTSLKALGLGKLPTVLLHRAADRSICDGVVWSELKNMQGANLIGSIGVSAQTPLEFEALMQDKHVKHIQLPFNLLDWRWREALSKLVDRRDIKIHVRSIFLQGILIQNDVRLWPSVPNYEPSQIVKKLESICKELNRKTIADLCIAYVRAMKWVDGLVLGTDSAEQLVELMSYFEEEPLTYPEVFYVQESLPSVPEQVLNPALWP